MDATIALLRELAPLVREYGWPAVWLVVLLPYVARIANAHVRLIDTLRRCIPRAVRNQTTTASSLEALIAILRDRGKPTDRKPVPLAELLQP